MKKVCLCMGMFVALSLCISSTATATLINQMHGGDRVVYDTLNDLYWYPILTHFTGMTRAEQETAIDNLVYAGTDNWRMATATETTVQKKSLAEMATTVIPTSWADYGNPSDEPRTLSSPFVAYEVFPADFFTPTGTRDGVENFWSGDTPAYMFNGRTTGWGWTMTGPGGFGGDMELLYAAADDHFVAHSLMSDCPYSTITYNYDLHLRDDEATSMGMGGIGAWVVTERVAPVPEPATMLLFGTGLAGLAGYRKRKAMKKS